MCSLTGEYWYLVVQQQYPPDIYLCMQACQQLVSVIYAILSWLLFHRMWGPLVAALDNFLLQQLKPIYFLIMTQAIVSCVILCRVSLVSQNAVPVLSSGPGAFHSSFSHRRYCRWWGTSLLSLSALSAAASNSNFQFSELPFYFSCILKILLVSIQQKNHKSFICITSWTIESFSCRS